MSSPAPDQPKAAPSHMKAARIHEYGAADVLRIEEVPVPEPGPNDVRIRVHASSVNPVDTKIRAGYQRALVRLDLPWILGMDVSGEVDAVGRNVTRFSVGDAVFSSPTHKRPGCYAEYVCIDQAEVAVKPASLTWEEAASLPLVALTAWDCLVRTANVQPGQKVLIQAGSGGVGTVAIQIAKHLGATVATTCSPRNAELVRSLGADVVIDYRTERFEDIVSDYDVVLESIGGEVLQRSLTVLRRGGRLTSIMSGLPDAAKRYGPTLGAARVILKMVGLWIWTRLKGTPLSMVVRKPDGDALAQIGALVDAGAIRPVIDRSYPLDAIAEAHAYNETGRARGKIVICVR